MATSKKSTYRNGKEILEELLALETWDEDIKGNRCKLTFAELLHVKMLKKALDGDLKAYAEVLDRVEGKSVQKVEESVEHTFVSKPLSELVGFSKPTKTLDENTNEVVELKESKTEANYFTVDTESEIEGGEDGSTD